MQKKIIALAIAAAVSAPALADNANVTIYGKAFLNVESVKNNKVAAPKKDNALRVMNNASRLGVKGSEDVGADLKAIYQFEVEMDASGNTGAGLGKTRNSGVGMEGGFGKFIVGIWDTPFKVAHNKIELFDNTTSFTSLSLIGQAGTTASSSTATNYTTRQANMIQYWTPNFNGLQGAISYSPDTAPQTTGATGTGDKSRLSFSGTYDLDAIYVSAAYESRPAAMTATAGATSTANTTDSALRLVGRYNFGDAWLGATYETIKANTSATANYSQKNLEFVGQYKFGASKVALSYAKAGSTSVANTGANQVTLRYGFDFSKRTEFFAAYASLKNNTSGTYALNNAYAPIVAAAGSTQTVIGAGLIHSF